MIGEELLSAFEEALTDEIEAADTKEARERVKTVLDNWISFTARKKPLPDLPSRLEIFRKRIEHLAETFEIRYSGSDLVVTATGEDQATLAMIERGTDWFDPADDVKAMIVGAFFERT